MKFNIDNDFDCLEKTIATINSVKNSCNKNGNLEDFINTIDEFDRMAEDNVRYFCTKSGKLYVDKGEGSYEISFKEILAYTLESDRLILYRLGGSILTKAEHLLNGEVINTYNRIY